MSNNEIEILSGFNLQKVNQCPTCQSSSRRKYDRRHDKNRVINCVQCNECELVYMDAVITEADLDHFYKGYNQQRLTNDVEMEAKRNKMYLIDVEYTKNFISSNHSTLIDIGCGEGDFLAKFQSNHERFGIEIDSVAIKRAQFKHPSIKFFNSLKQASNYILKDIDVALFRGTIQYMTNLHSVAEFCRTRIRSGGLVILLATPNADSLLAQILREDWGLYNSIEHRYCFGVKQLQLLFGNEFKLIDYDLPYFRTPYENYIDDLSKVCSLISDPTITVKQSIPFFGSMMNIVLERK